MKDARSYFISVELYLLNVNIREKEIETMILSNEILCDCLVSDFRRFVKYLYLLSLEL